ncbi:3-phosphoshikimate 1-carboxyvinyltransferase [Thermodesulfobacterium sp.]|jgi:3-phosphoshikimate 1-carboxyvinyltransferase|uniref:3-phosphoshikimate 1-carboxyvinyltransferase n=1 Tax=Thermodesulfobacterium sp. TaxID=1965289 RepID=UPI0025804674|nr:3-phosphoshikimate 1-carboxyvinyltransferase [Thermodesulfobacterium sp.]MBZ4681920.1 hypothetical protein [Thermodesulfobacterium sp.]
MKSVKPILPLKGLKKIEIELPSSKSLTQRALICASLAEGKSQLVNPLISEDTLLLKDALVATNIEVKVVEEEKLWEIKGGFPPLLSGVKVYLGNNGTGSRFFLSYACLGKGSFIDIYGKPRLHERPVKHLVEALRKLNAKIECLEKEGYFPIRVKSNVLRSESIVLPGDVSSQFVSSLLLIGPYLPNGVEILIEGPFFSRPYVEITLEVMKEFGVEVYAEERYFKVSPGRYKPSVYEVEADASSSSYFLGLPLILGEGEVVVKNYNYFSKQGDTKFIEFIKKMGACVEPLYPKGVRVAFKGRPKAVELDLKDTPDLFPTMCVLGAVAEGKTILKGAPHLRFKETDRIKAMVTELQKIGVNAQELPDGAVIEGTQDFQPAEIETYDDHRIAMSFALLGLKTGKIKIINPECVTKSFPDFWEYLEALYG